jgi:hypothetical protein
MGDFSSWLQDNWYEFGTLLAEFAFVAGCAWFAANVLRTVQALQDQISGLLKFLLTPTVPRSFVSPSDKEALAEGISSWLAPSEKSTSKPEPLPIRPNRFALASSHVMLWMQGPMSSPAAPWRRIAKWLQAPM